MRAIFTPEQDALAEVGDGLAADGLAKAREVLDGGPVPDAPTMELMAGFAGLGIPEDAGGAGGGLVDAVVLVGRLARRVVPTPYAHHLAAVHVARGAGIDVGEAAAGRQLWALAPGHVDGDVRAEGGTLRGDVPAVPFGLDADLVVVTTRDDRVVTAVPSGAQTRTPLDPTRPAADLAFDGQPNAEGGLGATEAFRRAVVLAAADLCGAGRGAVDLAAQYARVREQFGGPIGRFQGVAHQLADAFVGVEAALNLTLYAAWAVEEAAPGADRSVYAAKARAGQAAVHAAERCLQVHGGIGVTWEADPHLYLRRALAGNAWLGGWRDHARALGAGVVAAR